MKRALASDTHRRTLLAAWLLVASALPLCATADTTSPDQACYICVCMSDESDLSLCLDRWADRSCDNPWEISVSDLTAEGCVGYRHENNQVVAGNFDCAENHGQVCSSFLED